MGAPCDLADGAQRLARSARTVLAAAKLRGWTLATAESCTGGMVAALLTDIEGLGSAFECGFVVYTDAAKSRMLGIEPGLLIRHGAVSEQAALAMAEGVIARSSATLAVAITGFAGPGGPRDQNGLVYIALADRTGRLRVLRECRFGARDRDETRFHAASAALAMLSEAIAKGADPR